MFVRAFKTARAERHRVTKLTFRRHPRPPIIMAERHTSPALVLSEIAAHAFVASGPRSASPPGIPLRDLQSASYKQHAPE